MAIANATSAQNSMPLHPRQHAAAAASACRYCLLQHADSHLSIPLLPPQHAATATPAFRYCLLTPAAEALKIKNNNK